MAPKGCVGVEKVKGQRKETYILISYYIIDVINYLKFVVPSNNFFLKYLLLERERERERDLNAFVDSDK